MRKLLVALLLLCSTAHADYKLNLRYPATVGTLRLGTLSDDGGSTVTHELYTPAQAGNSSWSCGFAAFANPVGTRKNNTHACGWNLAPGGGALNPAYGFGGFAFEQFWNAAGAPVQEHYLMWEPPDGLAQQHRYLFFIGAETAPYESNLNLAATRVSISSGRDLNSPTMFSVDSATVTINGPSGYPRVQATDADGTVGIYDGDAGDVTKAQVRLNAAGGVNILSKQVGTLAASNGNVLVWASNQVGLYSPDQYGSVIIPTGTGPISQINGANVLKVQEGQVVFNQSLYGQPLGATPLTLGQSGAGVFGAAYVTETAANLQSCTGAGDQAITVVQGGGGSPDTVQACMKSAAGTYAWRTIYTAP